MATRTPPLVGAPLFGGQLVGADCYSQEKLVAGWLRTLAGNARCMREMTTGAVVDEAQPPCSPVNSRGSLGEDHSGVGFGAKLMHTFFHWGTARYGEAPSIGKNLRLYLAHQYGVNLPVYGPDVWFWFLCPSCYQGGVYDSVQCDVVAYCATARLTTSYTLQIWTDIGQGLVAQTPASTITLSTATEGAVTGSAVFPVEPGNIQRIRMRLYSSGPTGSALLGPSEIEVTSIALSVVNGS